MYIINNLYIIIIPYIILSITIIYITMKKRSSSKKPEMSINYLLKSRNVLYIVLFLSVANLFSYLMMKQLDAVAFFIIIGFLTTYFSKNMIIVMLSAVVSTFFLVQIKMLGNVQEGMKGNGEDEGMDHGEDEGMDHGEDEGMDHGEDEGMKNGVSTPEIPITEGQRNRITAAKEPLTGGPSKERYSEKKNKSENFSQKLSPAKYNQSDDDTMPNKKPKFDYADTVESAYDNLDKLLSSDAIKNMADDTGRLAEKQQQLMGHMDKVGPMVEKAAGLMEKFDFSKMSGMTDMLKNSMASVDKKAQAFSNSIGKAPK